MTLFHTHQTYSVPNLECTEYYDIHECRKCGELIVEKPSSISREKLLEDYTNCKQLTASYAIEKMDVDREYQKARAIIAEYQSEFYNI